jgi:hypothetical protein
MAITRKAFGAGECHAVLFDWEGVRGPGSRGRLRCCRRWLRLFGHQGVSGRADCRHDGGGKRREGEGRVLLRSVVKEAMECAEAAQAVRAMPVFLSTFLSTKLLVLAQRSSRGGRVFLGGLRRVREVCRGGQI